MVYPRSEDLLAIDDVTIPVPPGKRRDARDVAAGNWLGDRYGLQPELPARELG